MIIKQGQYTITHTVNMGNYENVKVEHSLLFDLEGIPGSVEALEGVEGAFAAARSHIDKAIKADLERAAQCTALGTDDTYIHEWIEEVY
jgi:hypothetical protein